ncbi:hypothetical protein [Ancylobacter pratisalsi]|uniref:Uncharacterized protein n=1 Tax=Ancylobacter pratisalsi TaxID=1745854 RepID=A0A6P1YJ75_9HYPH|nr:hypothetical protein [Ancylobacter pratisalsi]QIB33060.1 hypothetical protein G3A50_04535 [Ancylobacter pratisalsi]
MSAPCQSNRGRVVDDGPARFPRERGRRCGFDVHRKPLCPYIWQESGLTILESVGNSDAFLNAAEAKHMRHILRHEGKVHANSVILSGLGKEYRVPHQILRGGPTNAKPAFTESGKGTRSYLA